MLARNAPSSIRSSLKSNNDWSASTFGFNAQNTENGMKGAGTVIDHNLGVKIKILTVATFAVAGTHATFTGRAEVNGVEERIE